MKIKAWHIAVFLIVFIFGGILLSQLLGWWRTSGDGGNGNGGDGEVENGESGKGRHGGRGGGSEVAEVARNETGLYGLVDEVRFREGCLIGKYYFRESDFIFLNIAESFM